jgi:predicted metal-dependent hydrolase
VVVHELAHLAQANHSARFWQLVEKYCPNYKIWRRYLADHQYEADFLAKRSDLYIEEKLQT